MQDTLAMSAMTQSKLRSENRCHIGTNGVSGQARCLGFLPAFMDAATRVVYLSRFADGRIAPFHTLDRLPDDLILQRSGVGRVAVVKASVVSGFVRHGCFYTRNKAPALVEPRGRRAAGNAAARRHED